MQFAPLYPIIHRVLHPAFPDCLWQGQPSSKTIALTFDDGPHPKHTLQVLEVLERYQIKASFFWLGILIERFPEIARTVWQQEHWVGIHGYNHTPFPKLKPLELQQDLERTKQAIVQACQIDSPHERVWDVRPPNGFFTPSTLQLLRQWNYRPVMWSVVPEDWVRPGVPIAVRRVLSQTCNGSIIVLHDGYTGGEDAAATAALIIPQLLAQGYEFVTIDQLWQQRKIEQIPLATKTF